jgi:Cd2+/Zn2+-exporting ATPase/Cu+-exporting ATPase
MSKQHSTTELPAAGSAHFAASAPTAKEEERSPHPVVAQEPHGQQEHAQAFTWSEALRILVVALAAVAAGLRLWEPFSAFSLIGVAGLLIGCWPILKEALENILARRMTMELSMLIAIVAAAAIGQFFTALIITLFVLVAEVLET